MDKIQFNPEMLRMESCTITKFSMVNPEVFNEAMIRGFHTDNTLGLSFNFDESLVRANFRLIIKSESDNEHQAQASFNIVYIFHVENMEEYATPNYEKTEVLLDPLCGSFINSISYSTSRGILLSKLQGTIMQSFILPIVNVSKISDQQAEDNASASI